MNNEKGNPEHHHYYLRCLAWSFIDVVSDNNTMNPEHADTNAFVVLVNE